MPGVEVMNLTYLMEHWRPGSHDEPWDWSDEAHDLLQGEAHRDWSHRLTKMIQEDGITLPILLGNDGRVWDGHHRIVICDLLGISWVPVEIAAKDSELCTCEECIEARAYEIHMECSRRTVCALCGEEWLCEGYAAYAADDI